MRIPELAPSWIVWALSILLIILVGLRWRQRRHDERYGGHRPGREDASGHEHDTELDGGYTPGQKALLLAANEVRSVLDRQVREMGELRTFWSNRLDELDRRIGTLSTPATQPAGSRPDRDVGAFGGGTHEGERYGAGTYGGAPYGTGPFGGEGAGAGSYGAGMFGAEGAGWQPAGGDPSWSPGPGDQPVEVRDGVLVVSRSLPPAGYVSATGSGPARVYLNADVQLTEHSLPKWAAFFDLQGAKPYAAYRTRRPAEVRWDEGMGRGELVSKGTVEAI